MTTKLSVALALACLSLAACSQFEREQPLPAAAVTDDDAICRKTGEPGSSAYVACRRDRDMAASRASSNSGLERAHKNLADDMLNHR